MTTLDENIDYVEANHAALLAKYLNKFILVVDRKVVKAFDVYADAANYGIRKFGMDEEFLVRKMVRKEPINIVVSAILPRRASSSRRKETPMTELDKNFEYVKANYGSLLAKYLNKFIVVVDRKVVKAFDNYADAANYGVRNYGIDERFLVHEMVQEEYRILAERR